MEIHGEYIAGSLLVANHHNKILEQRTGTCQIVQLNEGISAIAPQLESHLKQAKRHQKETHVSRYPERMETNKWCCQKPKNVALKRSKKKIACFRNTVITKPGKLA